MKLLTEMADRMNGNGKHPVYNGAGIRPERAFARDVSAAHALMQAINAVASFPDEMPDEMWAILSKHRDLLTHAFRMAVLETIGEISQRADEIMREWGMDVSE